MALELWPRMGHPEAHGPREDKFLKWLFPALQSTLRILAGSTSNWHFLDHPLLDLSQAGPPTSCEWEEGSSESLQKSLCLWISAPDPQEKTQKQDSMRMRKEKSVTSRTDPSKAYQEYSSNPGCSIYHKEPWARARWKKEWNGRKPTGSVRDPGYIFDAERPNWATRTALQFPEKRTNRLPGGNLWLPLDYG